MRKKIKVGIDISDLKYAATGQKTFLEELINQIKKMNDDRFTFVYYKTPFSNFEGRNIYTIVVNHLQFQIWKQILLPIKAFFAKCDIIFCSDYFVPFFHLNFKSVQVFHDAFFFENPEHYNKTWLYLHKYLAMPAARKSSYIITPTDYAKQKVFEYAKIPNEKLVRIYEAPKTLSFNTNVKIVDDSIFNSFINGPYILSVGVLEKRKNVTTLIKAFKILLDNGLEGTKLVIAGKGTGRKESDDTHNIIKLITELNIENHIILTGYLTGLKLAIAYKNATLYVFPSLNEGFGIPVLEAFNAKIPIIVANNSCLMEVGGDAVIGFDPLNQQQLAEKILQLLSDNSAKKKLIEEGTKRLSFFSWEKTALELFSVFEKTISS
jgi:glycosyltransferase involved in cell wall biosynthesis